MNQRWWRDVDWSGACAFVIAVGLAVGFAGSLIFASTPWTESLSKETSGLLSTLGGAMAGALATYLGIGRRQERRESEPEPPPSEPEP